MARHLTEEVLLAAARGEGDAVSRAHLEGCGACRERVAQAREGLDLAEGASPVPEPSPLYWESFRLELGARIAAEREEAWPVRVWRRLGPALLPAAVAAALLIALVPAVRRTAPPVAGPILPVWEALPSSADDGALDVLRGLALQGSDLQAATECGSVVECLGEMNDEESRDVAAAFRGALPEGRS